MNKDSSLVEIKVINMIPLEWAATLVWPLKCSEAMRSIRGKTPRKKVIDFLDEKGIKYSQEALRNLENGATQTIDVQVFLALCNCYGIHPSTLIPSALVGVSNNFSS
jgi:hypothetical protein